MDTAVSRSRMRNGAFDLIKGMCIILVVFGHLPKSEGVLAGVMQSITAFVYTFHVPFFLILAGFFHAKKLPCFDEFKKVFRRLAIPYMTTGCVFIIFYAVANRLGIQTINGNVSFVKVVSGHAGGALWFVYTLMLLELTVLALDAITQKISSRRLRLVLLVAGTAIMPYVIKVISRGTVYVYSQWMAYLFMVGYFLRVYRGVIPAFGWGCLPLLPLWLYSSPEYWNWFRYALVPLFLFGFVWLMQNVDKYETYSVSALRFLGQHTMPIMLFHPLFVTCFKVPMRRLLNFGEMGGIIYYLAMTVMVVGACLTAERCLDRVRLSFVMGKLSKRK